MSGPMEFAYLEGKLRTRMDANQIKSAELTPAAAAQMNKFGLAEKVTVIRQDKKLVYAFYPAQKAVLTVPFSKQDAETTSKPPTIQKTPLGKETIDSHPCTKNKVIITDSQNQRTEVTTWNASDLKDFPVQIQTVEQGKTATIRFAQIQLAKPDPKLFDPPSGFAEFTSQTELMKSIAAKTMGAAPR